MVIRVHLSKPNLITFKIGTMITDLQHTFLVNSSLILTTFLISVPLSVKSFFVTFVTLIYDNYKSNSDVA